MKHDTFTFTDHAGVEIFVNRWLPDSEPKAVVQIVHGLGEHSARYEHVAKALTEEGYAVYADDHRGHGKTAGSIENLGQIDPDGWNGCVLDLHELSEKIRKDYPNLPLFILGHSWGSFMTQDYIQRWGNEVAGAILSGTSGKQDMLGMLVLIAKRIVKKEGRDGVSDLMKKLSLEPLNKPFAPNRTTHDWLSRDNAVVDAYLADPYCGFDMRNSYWLEFAYGLKKIWNAKNEAKIPKNLPIFLFCGSEDPVSKASKNFMILVKRYKKIGINDVQYKVYEGARHEVLNELQKDEAISDVINWLNAHMPK